MGGSGSEHRLSCNSMGGSLMVLPPEEDDEAGEGLADALSHWGAFKKMYKEMRRRVELDAVPWCVTRPHPHVCAEPSLIHFILGTLQYTLSPTTPPRPTLVKAAHYLC